MTTIDRLLTEWHTRTGAVGAAACVVTTEGLTWSAGVGYADLYHKVPFDPERSIMNIASVSKLVTATAVMQLVEAGRLDINAAVDRYLPFEVKHPTYPNYAITARQLLTHTAAIADGPAYWGSSPGDPSIELGSWLHTYFDPVAFEGSWHLGIFPGQQHMYSNVAFGLLGYLVEAVSGINFRRYTKECIFDPLSMTSTGWFLADVDTSRLASIYVEKGDEGNLVTTENGSSNRWSRLEPYGFPNYPDGLLRTTVADFGKFAAAMLGGGKNCKASVLKPETLAQMCTGIVPTGNAGTVQGLGWCQESATHPSAWGHNGIDPGVRTRLVVDFNLGGGVVFFTNCSIEVPEADILLTSLRK